MRLDVRLPRLVMLLALAMLHASTQSCRLNASGPRYVTGPPYFTGAAGLGIGWKQQSIGYSTDPGDLSGILKHQDADALVAAAAAVWNVPMANIALLRSGSLDEHVDGSNVYLSNEGLQWPTDVMSANASAVPLAIVYDTDGSVTDTLLGAGASDPSGCRQNAVTERVDAFDPAGYILHAVIILNGRCTGTAPEQQMQMQYELVRVFGRVLGLAWSQVNDNVFTGTPAATYDQALHWPIMHPIDVICGPYSYLCLPEPFTLRPDDLAGLVGLYPITSGVNLSPGKQPSLAAANAVSGSILFPDGEGMAGVNVLVSRQITFTDSPQDWVETAAVSGGGFRRAGNSPFTVPDGSQIGSMGSTSEAFHGLYQIPYVQVLDPHGSQTEVIRIEPVNPLYVGSHTLGAFAPGDVSPAGSLPLPLLEYGDAPGQAATTNFLIQDAPMACGAGTDGTPTSAVAAPATGWWTGLLCGYGHASYTFLRVGPGRTLTVEVTALDQNGFATNAKAMPVIAMFAASDAPGALPSVAVAQVAFQALGIGTTTLTASPVDLGSPDSDIRIGIADQRGEGRPDFDYQARIFYADHLMPTSISSGKLFTISGMGFRAGNSVLVDGVEAVVKTWSANAITVIAPDQTLVGALAGAALDVEVLDKGTGASSTISQALTYDSQLQGESMQLLTSPTSLTDVGATTTIPFAVQLWSGDGLTPVVGEAIVFTASNATFTACGSASCTLLTNGAGVATTPVSPTAAGTITLQATDGSLQQTGSFSAENAAFALKAILTPNGNTLVGRQTGIPLQVQVVSSQNQGIAGRTVTFSVDSASTGSAIFGGCFQTPCTVMTNFYGQAQVAVTATAPGTVILVAQAGSLSQRATFTAVANPDVVTLAQTPSASSYVGGGAGVIQAIATQSDGTPLANVPLTLTAPAGVIFTQCGTNICVLDTDRSGSVGSNVNSTATGTFLVHATYAGVSASAMMQVLPARPPTLTILSAPSGNVPVFTTATTPFRVQLRDGLGIPIPYTFVAVGGPLDGVIMSCGLPSCKLLTDGNGIVSQTVVPIRPGVMAVEEVYAGIVASATFLAVGPGESLSVTSPPPAHVEVGDTITIVLRGIAADGVSPVANRYVWVTVVSGSLALANCPFELCKMYTDPHGYLTITGTALQAGAVALSVNLDGIIQTLSFIVLPATSTLRTVSAPPSTLPLGTASPAPFQVQVLAADGSTPVAGQQITFSLGSGGATVAACNSLPCMLVTDIKGMASTGRVTGTAPGVVLLRATDNALSQTVSFTVTSTADVSVIHSSPTTVFEGATSAIPFSVNVTLADRVTPAVGVTVTFSTDGSLASFVACGSSRCSLVTNSKGQAQSTLVGLHSGEAVLTATVVLTSNNEVLTAGLSVLANVKSANAIPSAIYVAEGSIITSAVSLSLIENGLKVASNPVNWTGSGRVALSAISAVSDANGLATTHATAGPLGAGAQAKISGCAWTVVCANTVFNGVSASAWQVILVSGAHQVVRAGVLPQPVVVAIRDWTGNPIVGALVSIGQTVMSASSACSGTGRCPAAQVLASGSSALITDSSGQARIVPIGVTGQATKTAISVSSGTAGFATAVVFSYP